MTSPVPLHGPCWLVPRDWDLDDGRLKNVPENNRALFVGHPFHVLCRMATGESFYGQAGA